MRQRDLIQWFVTQQNEKNNYSSVEEAAAEVRNVKAIIEVNNYMDIYMKFRVLSLSLDYWLLLIMLQFLIRREGYLIVVDDGRLEEAENDSNKPSRDERILVVAPNYVVDW